MAPCIDVVYSAAGFHGGSVTNVSACCENPAGTDGKRFIAYEIINRLEHAGNSSLLARLGKLVTERERRKGQLHKVFKDSFDGKAIITQAFLIQKINYIHNNPVSGKCPSEWHGRAEMLAKDFVEYEHSSASFYEIRLRRHHRPLHYLDL